MTKRNLFFVVALALFNLALLGTNTSVLKADDGASTAWFNCCKENTEGGHFCCYECCWTTNDCDFNFECQPN